MSKSGSHGTPAPAARPPGGRTYKYVVHESRTNPEGHAVEANCRSNGDPGNHAVKAVLGDQISSKNSVSQRDESLSMCTA